MAEREWAWVFTAVLLMFVIASLPALVNTEPNPDEPILIMQIFVSSMLVIGGGVLARKAFAYSLDAGVTHRLWSFYRFGVRPHEHLPKPLPFGIIIPSFFAFIGALANYSMMVFTFLTYETRALKHRAAKRFGHYSYAEMTDWHNSLIGASAIVFALVLSVIGYFVDFEVLAKLAAYYAFWNMVPFGDLDGVHIFFGNKVLYFVLGITTLIVTLYATVI